MSRELAVQTMRDWAQVLAVVLAVLAGVAHLENRMTRVEDQVDAVQKQQDKFQVELTDINKYIHHHQ